MRHLIVNADDFGFSPNINEGVCEAYEHGVVTDTSLLVHSPYAAHAIELAAKSGLPMGIHIDLVTSFVQARSNGFGPDGSLVHELFSREYAKQNGNPICCEQLIQVRDEIRSQIREFISLVGQAPSHVDYHFGLHYLPEVMALYLTVAEEFQIPVRWGRQYAGNNIYSLAPDCLCDHFRGLEAGGLDLFISLIRRPWEGIMEMICHPGYFTPDGLTDSYNIERENELKVLTDPRLKTELNREGIQLVDYHWLKAYYSPSTGTTNLTSQAENI